MRSRRIATLVGTTLGTLALVLGTTGPAQAAPRDPVTKAECWASGGMVIPLGVAYAICEWRNPDGTTDTAVISDVLGRTAPRA
ncbi:hypothetical protein [Streptomyces sp. NPDC054784]